jgi:hypothetical protein
MQAKEKLAALYKAVVEGTYRVEGNKLYAPDGTWMYVREEPCFRTFIIHGWRLGAFSRSAEASARET